MNKKIIAVGFLSLLSGAVSAYQLEVGAGISSGEIKDSSDSVDMNGYSLGLSYYFNDVEKMGGPLSEQAFLNKASGISIVAGVGDLDFDGSSDDTDFDHQSARINIVNERSGWFAVVGASNWYGEDNDGYDVSLDYVSLGLGKYIDNQSSIALTFEDLDLDDNGDEYGSLLQTYALRYKYVSVEDALFSIELGLMRTELDYGSVDEDGTGFSVSGTYYLDKSLGLGLGYSKDVLDLSSYGVSNITFDEIDSDSVSVHAEWFVSEGLSVLAKYIDLEVEGIDMSNAEVSVAYRF